MFWEGRYIVVEKWRIFWDGVVDCVRVIYSYCKRRGVYSGREGEILGAYYSC